MLRMEIALFLVLAFVAFYLLLCAGLLLWQWGRIDPKKKFAIAAALVIEFTVCALQGLHHTWLISGMGITLMTLSFYLTLENPDILRAELTEQKMSMLYLKSQVNPHFSSITRWTASVYRPSWTATKRWPIFSCGWWISSAAA